jgi:cytochrome c
MAYHVEAKDNPLSDEDADVLVATNDSWVSYGPVDLSGISGIRSTVMLVPNVTSGGTIEVVAGDPRNGEVVGEVSLSQGVSTYGLNEVNIPVKSNTQGEQPLYFRFAADSKSPEAVMGAIGEFEFVPSRTSK